MENYLYAIAGGLLIGLASSLLLMGIGRIAGISGIIRLLMKNFQKENFWRLYFVLGLLFGGFFMLSFYNNFFSYSLQAPVWKVIAAGLLVGFGTSLGSGCTSGHGVCGMARLSKRSILATITFILIGMLTVFIVGRI